MLASSGPLGSTLAMTLRCIVACLFAVLTVGCDDTSGIPTSDMVAIFSVRSFPDKQEFRAELYEETSSSLELDIGEGDRLVATVDGGKATELEKIGATIEGPASTVRITLERDSGDDGYIEADVQASMALDGTTFAQGADVTLTWSNPIQDAEVVVFVDSCADFSLEGQDQKEFVPDTGSYTISQAEMAQETGVVPDCAKLEIQRRVRTPVPADGGFLSNSAMFVRRIEEAELSLTP